MINYKLEIYKIPSVEIILKDYRLFEKNNSLVMTFTDSSKLKKNDLIWAESDMAQNDTSQMLVIQAVMPSGKVRLKRPIGEESIHTLREFKEEEKFKVVASFIPIYEELNPKGYSERNSGTGNQDAGLNSDN